VVRHRQEGRDLRREAQHRAVRQREATVAVAQRRQDRVVEFVRVHAAFHPCVLRTGGHPGSRPRRAILPHRAPAYHAVVAGTRGSGMPRWPWVVLALALAGWWLASGEPAVEHGPGVLVPEAPLQGPVEGSPP